MPTALELGWFERAAPQRRGEQVLATLRGLDHEEILRPSEVAIELVIGPQRLNLPGAEHAAAWQPVRLSVAPERADALLLGELHEAAELLTGGLEVAGAIDAVMRTIPALGRLGGAYRAALGVTAGLNRHEVLRFYRPPPGLLDAYPWPAAIEGDDAGRTLCAALVVLGLPPVCRGIELGSIVQAHVEGALSAARLTGFGLRLAELAAAARRA